MELYYYCSMQGSPLILLIHSLSLCISFPHRQLFWFTLHVLAFFVHMCSCKICTFDLFACKLILCKWYWWRHHSLFWISFNQYYVFKTCRVDMCTFRPLPPSAARDSVVCLCHTLFTFSPEDGRPDSPQLHSMSNNAAMNIRGCTEEHVWERGIHVL